VLHGYFFRSINKISYLEGIPWIITLATTFFSPRLKLQAKRKEVPTKIIIRPYFLYPTQKREEKRHRNGVKTPRKTTKMIAMSGMKGP